MDLSILYFQGSQVKLFFFFKYISVSLAILAISADPDEISIVAFHLDLHCCPKLKGEMICWSEVPRGEYKNIHFARRWNYKYYHTFNHYPYSSNQPVYIELNGSDCLCTDT